MMEEHHALTAAKHSSYIHGGAWRDPEIDSMAFGPAFELLSVLRFQQSIAGFASINYRLSPYSDHPVRPSSLDDPSRNAKHPDHLLDVSRALAFLEKEYSISSGYLLVGHSAGATMAFQLQEQNKEIRVPVPLGILGVEGIYDLPELVKTYEAFPVYKQFVTDAFGSKETVWENASPASSDGPAAWMKAKAIMIAYSDEDELIDRRQAELMLGRVRNIPGLKERAHYFTACGRHDDIWKDGHELQRLIEKALELI